MRIASYKLFKVPPRWVFLKIETNEGISGWGEPIVEGKADSVCTAVDEMMKYLVDKDPMNIEDHWSLMYRGAFYRGGPILMSAISGIDQALWDIKGKYFSAPIHQLMGGKVRDTIKVYSWIAGDLPADISKAAEKAVKQGYTALKMNATEELQYIDSFEKIDHVVNKVAAIRETVGRGIGIGIDFHGRLHKGMAKVMAKELEPYGLMFIEEPVLPENNEALKEISRHTSIPIATGERMFSRWEFKNLFAAGLVDIIQPDLSHAGGITECKKIISMAEAYDVAAAPHCPLGPIALAACLQVDATCHNACLQEQSLDIHRNEDNPLLDYLTDASVFNYNKGFITIPSGPGLGISINEEYLDAMSKNGHNWKNPVWRHADGSVAEW